MADYPVFTIDKDEDAPMRAFNFAKDLKDLYERIIEAENLAFMNEIKANTVVINGQKYGMLKDKPGIPPTIFGMRAETKADMPNEWDFFLQERPPKPKTNADKLRAMSDEELSELFADNNCGYCRIHDFCFAKGCQINCEDVWLDWLRQEASE